MANRYAKCGSNHDSLLAVCACTNIPAKPHQLTLTNIPPPPPTHTHTQPHAQPHTITSPWPSTNFKVGSRDCLAFSLNFSGEALASFLVPIIFLYFVSVALAGVNGAMHSVDVFATTFLGALDVLTDLVNATTTVWFSQLIAVISILFILTPNIIFIHELLSRKIFPQVLFKNYIMPLFWLEPKNGLPSFKGKPMYVFKNHDSLPKLAFFCITWVVCLFLQSLCFLVAAILIIPSFLWTAFVLFIGIILYATKVFPIGRVRYFWYVCAYIKLLTFNSSKKCCHQLGFFCTRAQMIT